MGWLLFSLQGVQVGLSAMGGYYSYIAITNLQQYESVSEKAAKYSNTADNQLQRTRTTSAAGAISLLFSLASAVYLAVKSAEPGWWQTVLSIANAAVVTGARAYMMDFWSQKRTVPLIEGYNKGIENSNRVNDFLQYLTFTWVMSSIVTFAG